MSEITFNQYPHSFTATVLERNHLLAKDAFKDIIFSSLQFLVKDGGVKMYGFAIMPNIFTLSGKYKINRKEQRFNKALRSILHSR